MENGTTSSELIPGWYRQLWLDVLSQLPKPEEISQEVSEGWHDNRATLRKGLLELLVPSVKAVAIAAKGLLKYLRDVPLGSVGRFVAAEKFTKENPLVKFWGFGTNFTTNFGNRVEKNVAAVIIAVSRLERRAKDPEITNELVGGETKRVFRISLAHFYQMIETQGQGQTEGPLLVNGYANIAYIEDVYNWAVDADWVAGRGWDVNASPVDYPIPWYDEGQVLSRKSS
ncbi:MAG TPA: hypothetical protein VJC06_02470 [Candidatus Paceibacterota bacterium]